MAISDQFKGLDMKNLIGGPLSAAADASVVLANSTADFINKVGFDSDGKTRTVKFGYHQTSQNDDGTTNKDEMNVDVPILAITPIPNLQIDDVDILFDMEVKETSKTESSNDLSASGSASVGFLGFKMNVSGSVSSHSSNTRSSDNSAKYHVEVTASNHGTPEGLARVLDMMAANISPALISSTPKDADGQDLSDERKKKVKQNKKLSMEVTDLNRQVSAAKNSYESQLTQFKRVASSQLNEYLTKINSEISNYDTVPEGETDEQKAAREGNLAKWNTVREQLSASWNDFQNMISGNMEQVADSLTDEEKKSGKSELSAVFALKGIDSTKEEVVEYKKDSGDAPSKYAAMLEAQNAALKGKLQVKELEEKLLKKNTEYNNSIAGI